METSKKYYTYVEESMFFDTPDEAVAHALKSTDSDMFVSIVEVDPKTGAITVLKTAKETREMREEIDYDRRMSQDERC